MAGGHGSPASLIRRNTGMFYQGAVSAVPGADQYTVPRMAGFPAGQFTDAQAPWYIKVLRDAGGAGAAPQGQQHLITAYAVDGTFTAPGFVPAIAAGDEIQIISGSIALRFDDTVYFKSSGTAGTSESNGTAQNPSNSLTDIRTILTARGTNIIQLVAPPAGVTTATLDADMPGIVWKGAMGGLPNEIIDLNGFSVHIAHFEKLSVKGVAHAASPDLMSFYLCDIYIKTNPIVAYADQCLIDHEEILPLATGNWSFFFNCRSETTDGTRPSQISVPAGAVVSLIAWSGDLKIYNMGVGSVVNVNGEGTIILDASCVGGEITRPITMRVNDQSGNLVTIKNSEGGACLALEGTVSALPGANQFTVPELAGLPAGMLVDAANPWFVYVKHNKLGTSAAPQGEVRPLTAATTAGVFTAPGFTAPGIGVGDTIQLLSPSQAATISPTYGNQQIKADTAAILAALGGAIDSRFFQSASGPVEEDAIQGFDITIFDVDLGAVLQANIDITGITAVMEKSTGGGAYSSVGITQPSFAKADGRVYASYRFLAAEWAVGDMYRLRVTGISATVDAATVYCPAMVWSNRVDEAADVFNAVQKMWKQVDSADVNITAILASETDVLNLAAAANTTYKLEHLRLKVADPGVNTVYVRLYEEVNGALTLVDTKNVDSTNFADYFSLMDLFSLAQSVGNNIKVTVQTSAGGPYAVTANYSYATATV